ATGHRSRAAVRPDKTSAVRPGYVGSPDMETRPPRSSRRPSVFSRTRTSLSTAPLTAPSTLSARLSTATGCNPARWASAAQRMSVSLVTVHVLQVDFHAPEPVGELGEQRPLDLGPDAALQGLTVVDVIVGAQLEQHGSLLSEGCGAGPGASPAADVE